MFAQFTQYQSSNGSHQVLPDSSEPSINQEFGVEFLDADLSVIREICEMRQAFNLKVSVFIGNPSNEPLVPYFLSWALGIQPGWIPLLLPNLRRAVKEDFEFYSNILKDLKTGVYQERIDDICWDLKHRILAAERNSAYLAQVSSGFFEEEFFKELFEKLEPYASPATKKFLSYMRHQKNTGVFLEKNFIEQTIEKIDALNERVKQINMPCDIKFFMPFGLVDLALQLNEIGCILNTPNLKKQNYIKAFEHFMHIEETLHEYAYHLDRLEQIAGAPLLLESSFVSETVALAAVTRQETTAETTAETTHPTAASEALEKQRKAALAAYREAVRQQREAAALSKKEAVRVRAAARAAEDQALLPSRLTLTPEQIKRCCDQRLERLNATDLADLGNILDPSLVKHLRLSYDQVVKILEKLGALVTSSYGSHRKVVFEPLGDLDFRQPRVVGSLVAPHGAQHTAAMPSAALSWVIDLLERAGITQDGLQSFQAEHQAPQQAITPQAAAQNKKPTQKSTMTSKGRKKK